MLHVKLITSPGRNACGSTLPAGNLAMVGSLPIAAETVKSVASARGIAPREALDREIKDALFASGAHSEETHHESPRRTG